MITDAGREKFLRDDFSNTLRSLFEGAIAWDAWKQSQEKQEKDDKGNQCRHLGVLGMYTAFMEARALYEFFHEHGSRRDDDARADDFASGWKANRNEVYKKYMAPGKPANKRMFHLVYGRDRHSGGIGTEGDDHLNEQVLNVARDLHQLTKEFVEYIDTPIFQEIALASLKGAESEAQRAADHYSIANPLAAAPQ